jgi:hypothetical protein
MLTIYIFVPVTNGQVISCITFFITKCDSNKKIVAETKKLESNSSYGRTVTNKERHADVLYCQEQQVSRHLMDSSFRRCNQLDEKTFELEMSKKTIHLDLPMHIGCFVYQYAKLRMLQFYYDFVNVFVDRRDFQYCAMDTDSAYMALSGETLEEVIKPDLRQVYDIEKKNWLPWNDTPEHAAYDKRTPGLFKEEYSGDGIIALCSKTYYCFGKKTSSAASGSTREPTRSPKTSTWMFCCRRSLDSVPTEGFAQWTTRYLPTSSRGVASRTSTQNGKSWKMGSLQHHWRFDVRGTLCI